MNVTKRFFSVFIFFALLFVISCSKKSAELPKKEVPTVKKADTAAVIPEECKKFIPPWGDDYWESWGKAHPAQFEKWYSDIMAKMKSVTVFDDKKCGMLDNVFIGFSAISDLSPFARMPKLKKLDMRFAGGVKDLTPLSHSQNLEYLNIWKTKVTDLRPIARLPKLKRIDAKMTEITDVTPLKTLKSLESVDLLQSKVSDISSLASLPKLHEILVCSTAVSDISAFYPIADRITYIDLCNTTFRDFDKFRLFSHLKTAKLWGLPIKDLSVLKNAKNLEYLDLWNSKVTDISPLFKLKKLNYLVLRGCNVPKKQINQLKKLNKGITIVTDE